MANKDASYFHWVRLILLDFWAKYAAEFAMHGRFELKLDWMKICEYSFCLSLELEEAISSISYSR